MNNDDRTEALLRQFRPRAPGALPPVPAHPWTRARAVAPWTWPGALAPAKAWLGVAAAAAVALFAANVRFMPMASLASDIGSIRLTVYGMRGLIDADPAMLDQVLLDASSGVLPDVEAPDSALRPFARP